MYLWLSGARCSLFITLLTSTQVPRGVAAGGAPPSPNFVVVGKLNMLIAKMEKGEEKEKRGKGEKENKGKKRKKKGRKEKKEKRKAKKIEESG